MSGKRGTAAKPRLPLMIALVTDARHEAPTRVSSPVRRNANGAGRGLACCDG